MGLFRKCRLGHDIKIYYGTRFLPAVVREGMKKGSKYFLVVDGVLARQSKLLPVVEKAYNTACKKKHKPSEKITGHFDMFKHKLHKGVVVTKEEAEKRGS